MRTHTYIYIDRHVYFKNFNKVNNIQTQINNWIIYAHTGAHEQSTGRLGRRSFRKVGPSRKRTEQKGNLQELHRNHLVPQALDCGDVPLFLWLSFSRVLSLLTTLSDVTGDLFLLTHPGVDILVSVVPRDQYFPLRSLSLRCLSLINDINYRRPRRPPPPSPTPAYVT